MTNIDLEGRVNIRLEVPDNIADLLTEDDLYEMAQDAVGASEPLKAHLVIKSIAQWENFRGRKHMVEVTADVELNRCEEIGRDRRDIEEEVAK